MEPSLSHAVYGFKSREFWENQFENWTSFNLPTRLELRKEGFGLLSIPRCLPANSVYGISIDVLFFFPSLWSFFPPLFEKRQELAVPDSSIPPAVAWLFFSFILAVVWASRFWGLAATWGPRNGERGPPGYHRRWLCFNHESQGENFLLTFFFKFSL